MVDDPKQYSLYIYRPDVTEPLSIHTGSAREALSFLRKHDRQDSELILELSGWDEMTDPVDIYETLKQRQSLSIEDVLPEEEK
jgi:hypothetical protein